jgi:hypothetical protein
MEVPMATTFAALRRAGVPSAAAPFVTLGPRQFAVLAVSLLLYGLLYAILLAPFITRHFARTEVQAHERAFGFRLGLIDEGQIHDWHIVEVTPGGRFARAGFRAGDVPSERDSNGLIGLAETLRAAETGRTACLTVWNEDPFGARREVCLSP